MIISDGERRSSADDPEDMLLIVPPASIEDDGGTRRLMEPVRGELAIGIERDAEGWDLCGDWGGC